MTTMRAMGQKSWGRGVPLELTELPTPEVGAGDVRVAIKAIGVNPVDWKMREGGPIGLAYRVVGPALPFVPGFDFAGVVDAVGADVTGFKAGDRVVGAMRFWRGQRGSYADTAVVRGDQLCPIPDEVSFEVAAGLPVTGITAWMCLVDIGRIREAEADGRRVLVLGASGGVGQIAVQVAKSEGAFVAGVCSTKNVELVRSLGADEVIDYSTGDALEKAEAYKPYRVVVDCVGGYSGARCRRLLGPGGRHVMVAGDTPAAFLQVLIPPFTSKSITGYFDAARLTSLLGLVTSGRLRVEIAHRLRLDEAEEAHRLSRAARATGKIILQP